MTSIKLYEGNCLDVLRKCPDNYMDSIVTDPPYGLSFMGKAWDYDVPTQAIWKECLRVLKPGGHLLAFGGTRTYHRLVVNIEDAGFEIRDQIMWIYGSGFPKSMDISKSIDKEAGATPIDLGPHPTINGKGLDNFFNGNFSEAGPRLTAPATDDAKKWSGYGTALKPANEPICLARKPLSEKTVAKNVLKHGVGGLNVDASRIGFSSEADKASAKPQGYATSKQPKDGLAKSAGIESERQTFEVNQSALGRFPANILFDEFAAGVLDEQVSKTMKMHGAGNKKVGKGEAIGEKSLFGLGYNQPSQTYDGTGEDSTKASRFFYVAKASKKDRGEGNTHPTVKPIKLMEYLVKLVTPEGGIVLDPFMGSGTTGVACQNLGFGFRGIEMTPEYYEICKARILGAAKDVV